MSDKMVTDVMDFCGKNAEAATQAMRVVFEGYVSAAAVQSDAARKAMASTFINPVIQKDRASPDAFFANASETAKANYDRGVASVQQSADIITEAWTEAFDVLSKRASEVSTSFGK